MNREDAKDAKKSMDIEEVATHIVNAAIKVHRTFGPGLLESAYQHCHVYELRKRGLKVDTEVVLPIVYDSQLIDAGFRLMVNNL